MSINLHTVWSVNDPYLVLSWFHLYRDVVAKATAAKLFGSQSWSQTRPGRCGGSPLWPAGEGDAGRPGNQQPRTREVSIHSAGEDDR